MDDRGRNYVMCIAQCGSIAKATEKLYVTSSALSKYVQNLEKTLGVRLFDRVGKRFVLTYAGERFLFWTQKIEDISDEMMTEMQNISGATSGRIRIGRQMGYSGVLAQRILPKFYACYPNIKVELYEDSSTMLRRMLEDNNLDFILAPETSYQERYISLPLIEGHKVLITPEGSELRKKAENRKEHRYPWVDISLCRDERFVSPFPNQESYRPFEELYRDYGIRPNIVLRTKYINSILDGVRNGIGFTISRDDIVRASDFSSGTMMFSYGNPSDANYYALVYHKDHFLDAPARAFVEICRDAYYQIQNDQASAGK